MDEEATTASKSDLSTHVDGLRNDLKTIMRNLKLRGLGNGRQQAASYNANVTAEVIHEHNDLFAADWTAPDKTKEDVLIGERAERLECFSSEKKPSRPWKLFHPIARGHFNRSSYAEHYGASSALQALLSDLRAIWSHALTSPCESDTNRQEAGQIIDIGLGISAKDWYKYNVVLIIPDLYMMAEVEELVRLLLEDMGFAGIMVQQEGVCATFGAGLSSSCVVHIGGDRTTISCVEEGLIIPDSRTTLNFGGKDVSRFFLQLLQRINFPYQGVNMEKRLADVWLADQLKEKLCTLDVNQLGLLINDFHLRLPHQSTKKFALRTYDEIVIAPMALFSPKAFALDSKSASLNGPLTSTSSIAAVEEDGDEVESSWTLPTTMAMTLCVRHLMPAAPPPPPPAPVTAATNEAGALPVATSSSAQGTPAATPAPQSRALEPVVLEPISLSEPAAAATTSGNITPAAKEDDGSLKSERASPAAGVNGSKGSASTASAGKSAAPSMDVPWESSKIALDFAVWNSIQASISNLGSASTSEERVRKMSANMICTGGSAMIPGIGFALEARVNNYLAQWYAHHGKDAGNSSINPSATVVPPPRDMDPRLLAWKGMSVLARLDGAQEMWIPRQDWQTLGLRALKEKSLFL